MSFENVFVNRDKIIQMHPDGYGWSTSAIGCMSAPQIKRQFSKYAQLHEKLIYFCTIDLSTVVSANMGAFTIFAEYTPEFDIDWSIVVHDPFDIETNCKVNLVCEDWSADRTGYSFLGGHGSLIQGELSEVDNQIIKNKGLCFAFQIDVEDLGDYHPQGSELLADGCLYCYAMLDVLRGKLDFSRYHIVVQNT